MKTNMLRWMLCLGVVLLLIFPAVFLQGAPKDKNITKATTSETSGEISAIGKDHISIIYKRDDKTGTEYEMLVPLDAATKLERKNNLSELSIGDTVKVQYEDVSWEEEGGEKKMERKAKIISYVRAASNKPAPPTPPEPGDGLPDD